MWLIRATAMIGSMTLISRVLGFLRDMLMANMLGASWMADAFFVAFRLPNLLRRLFAEGAFNAAFVPLFSGIMVKDGKQEAKRFAEESMACLFAVLIVVTVLAIIIMPWLILIFAPGFSDFPEKYDLTILLTRITFPYIILISLVSLLGGILNSLDRFAAVAATPILMNLSMIFAMLVLVDYTPTPAHALAWGAIISGVAQLVWLMWFCQKQNMLPRFSLPKMTPHVKKLLFVVAPATLGASVAQINLLVDTIMASLLPGAVSWLYYADRINELPLGVIGVGVSTALLPALSKKFKADDHQGAMYDLNRAVELTLLFALPSCAALMCVAEPIIKVMFEHGSFSAIDTQKSAAALAAFAFGLPSFVLIKIMASCFFANQDTKTPFLIATFCLILNFHLNLTLIGHIGHVGLALSTSLTGWFNALGLMYLLRKRGLFEPDSTLYFRVTRLVLASIVMASAVLCAQSWLASIYPISKWHNIGAVCALVASGVISFAIMLMAYRVFKLGDIFRHLKSKKSADKALS